MTYLNIPMLSVLVLAAALAIAALASPSWMRWMAARLMARAESIEGQRRIQADRLRYWLEHFEAE